MKIFVSLKVPRGDAALEQLAALTTEVIRQAGHIPFVAPQEIAERGLTDPKKFMPFVELQVATSDLMIVLYHPELRGGLIELGLAYACGIPIWLCYPSGQRVSNSALGCADLTIEYADLEDLQKQLSTHLRQSSQI
jgi:hypothetical protein